MSDQANGDASSDSRAAQQLTNIKTPHDHDVLSGRGNFVNYHAGNEYFRTLVRKYKFDYVKCPKAQKAKFSKLIVDEIRTRDPPGRFLKLDADTKLWHDIGEKKALDKTRQALREGAPELEKELQRQWEKKQQSDDEGVEGGDPPPRSSSSRSPKNSQVQAGMMRNRQAPTLPSNTFLDGAASQFQYGSLAGFGGMNQLGTGGRVVPGMSPLLLDQMAVMQQAVANQRTNGTVSESMRRQMEALSVFPHPGMARTTVTSSNPDFEPTPINPSEMRVMTSSTVDSLSSGSVAPPATSSAPSSRGIERADSLTFDSVFVKEGNIDKSKDRGNASSHMSGMSFSLGDMSDATANLSAVFEDSMRIADDPPIVASNAAVTLGTLKDASEHTKSSSRTSRRNLDVSTNFDMSMATIGSGSELNGSVAAMGMSFNKVFDDSTVKSDDK